jgi:hypothetical protein
MTICVGDTVWLNEKEGKAEWDKGWTVTSLTPSVITRGVDTKELARTHLPWKVRIFPSVFDYRATCLGDYDNLRVVRDFDSFQLMCADCEGLLRLEEISVYDVRLQKNHRFGIGKVQIADKAEVVDSYIVCDCPNDNDGGPENRVYGIDIEEDEEI